MAQELTRYGKTIVAFVWSGLVILEQTFGFNLGIGEHEVTDIIAALAPVAVWFMPGR